jgi:hypothetical protein
MATFKVVDELNAPLISTETPSTSGLGKYLPAPVLELMALRPLAKALNKPLADTATTPIAAELSSRKTLPVAGAGSATLEAGARVGVGVYQGGELLFPADDLRDAVTIASGTAYVSVGLSGRLSGGAEVASGPASLGVAGGASLTTRYFHPFDLAARTPTLGEALIDTVAHAVIPSDADDLALLPAGAFASFEGEGNVQFTGAVDLASVINPLATPGLPVIGSAKLTAGASVSVGAVFGASGAFEIRASRVSPETVRLGCYRRSGSTLEINASASVGIAATVRDSDVIKRFITAVSSDPKADLTALINANLSDEQIETLQQAIAGSVNRTLRIAAELQFSSVRRGEALFAFDIDVSALTKAGRAAVADALKGRLTALQEAASTSAPGIRIVHTGILRTRERRTAWRFNLLGIVNVSSVAELVSTGTLTYDPLTGELNAADSITSKHIVVKTRPFESDGEKVRKLMLESVMVSAAYQASRLTAQIALACRCSHFESRAKTASRDLREDFNAVVAMGLADSGEAARRIGDEHDFGRSTFLLECAFDQNAADALFIGPDGPRTREYYERVGRDTLLGLIPADDLDRAHRRAAVADDGRWAAMTAGGPTQIRFDLTKSLGALRAEHVVGDYLVIQWWSDAMARAAAALMEMRRFLGGRSAASLASDPAFHKKRGQLEKALADVVKDSKARFGDPWGIVALDAASRRAGSAQATIASPRLLAFFDTRVAGARAIQAGAVTRPMAAGTAATRKAPPRPLTVDEREALRRHAINLRMGALSQGGEIETTEADVERLFTELIPAEIEARKADGQKARILFYAHGGLIGEREGLEPVLKRLKFWRQNNVYPVSFVWETGLRETVMDIVGGLTAARSTVARTVGEDLADAVLEVAGRPGGKAVWSQMKRSAEVAVLEGGGGLLIADRVRELWNAHHADIEIHAVGHSAGAIFHSHFLPAVLARKSSGGAPPIAVRSLHLLAPACTTDLFKTKLMDRVGPGKGIEALTMYTMNKNQELADEAGPYKKSLLYLVSRAFEIAQPSPILGLEESLRDDVKLIRFFGLAGNQKRGDVLFSNTAPDAPLHSRTMSNSHGGFDDDAMTMNSVMRRVIGADDATGIVNYFQEPLQPLGATALATAPAAEGAVRLEAAPVVQPDPLPSRAAHMGARRALCVGIDRYEAPYQLGGCVNDARSWQAALEKRGFDVHALHDASATREAILAALGEMVGAARPGDVVVFQFAGHGTQVDDIDGDEGDDRLDEAFCPVDFPAGRFVIDDDVRAVFSGVRPGVNVTSFIDCCHSGTITRALVPGGRPPVNVPPGSKARFIPYSPDLSRRHREFRAEESDTETARGGGARTASRQPAGSATGMLDVCFSACLPNEVAYESGGAGQFTTRAARLLAEGGPVTHAAFIDRVVSDFGASPAQHPVLDCAPAAREHGLLQPAVLGV